MFLAIFVVRTWHWPLVGDAALMHYVVFLMDHGFAPYRDIIDPNMPGTYFIQGAVIHLLGGSALAWRIFDLLLLAASGLAMVVIALPYDWFAGVFAATLFALIHGRDGLIDVGQRDLMMTVWLVFGYMLLFQAMRSESEGQRSWRMALFGFCVGAASTIKPTASLFAVALLLLAAVTLRKRQRPFVLPIGSAVVGFALPCALALLFLQRWHATAAFTDTLNSLVPALTVLDRRSFPHLLWHSISSTMLPLFFLWLPVAYARRNSRSFERSALFLGVVLGLLSFYIQRKGYPYHRYPSEVFLLLLIGTDFTTALTNNDWKSLAIPRRFAAAGLLVGVLIVGGGSLVHALGQDWRNQEFDSMLQKDLAGLGGDTLSGQVQCLDSADGCIPTLYNMRLVQDTGFMYDCYLLSPDLNSTTEQSYRERFWAEIQKKPPQVFIVSSNECTPGGGLYSYSKLDRWPLLRDYLNRNYRVAADRIPPHLVNWGSSPSKPMGYRVYVKKGPSAEDALEKTSAAEAP
ncbi:MAG TPA: hypothetical protein VGN01_11315 [Acidobacteriaceae bacterium]